MVVTMEPCLAERLVKIPADEMVALKVRKSADSMVDKSVDL